LCLGADHDVEYAADALPGQIVRAQAEPPRESAAPRKRARPRKDRHFSVQEWSRRFDNDPSDGAMGGGTVVTISREPAAIPTTSAEGPRVKRTRTSFNDPAAHGKLSCAMLYFWKAEADNRPVSSTELAKQHGVDRTTLSKRLKRGLDPRPRGPAPALGGLEKELRAHRQYMHTYHFSPTARQAQRAFTNLTAKVGVF